VASSDPQRVVVARVVKAHGIRGEVACDLLTDVPGRLDQGTPVTVAGRDTTIATSRPHQGRLLVRFEGVETRNDAELLRGSEVLTEPLPEAEHDAYFVHELVGMAVVDADGAPLGMVRALVELPAAAEYDLLEVERRDGHRWLLPAVDDYVEVELADDGRERLVVVDPPAGLLDEARADE
jgi:16S rRNA processing protein RimM